jgi:hypothetical protein
MKKDLEPDHEIKSPAILDGGQMLVDDQMRMGMRM